MTKLLRFLEKWPLFPVFGEGKALMQPVYVEDLADGILSAILQEEQTVNQSYNLCGPTPITYMQLLREACDALGNHPRFLHIPHRLAALLASVAEKVPGFPVTHEQVLRLVEDKSFDIGNTVRDLKYHARPFAEGIREEVECLRRKGLLKKARMT
jgi:nucleoside-diphosphate-sugar epimerase